MNQVKNKLDYDKYYMESQFKNIIFDCIQNLRKSEIISSERSLFILNYLLFLKMVESKLDSEIKLLDNPFKFQNEYFSKETLLNSVYFSKLANHDEKTISLLFNVLWNEILSKHILLQKMYLPGHCFQILNTFMFKVVTQKINSIDININNLSNDFINVISLIHSSKSLLQLHNSINLKKIMLDLIEPQVFDDGSFESCCDPTLGIGGFLSSYIEYVKVIAKEKKIVINWELIKSKKLLYGSEHNYELFHFCMTNMLISSGCILNLENGHFIKNPIMDKYDNIICTLPIIKTEYDFSKMVDFYIPIKCDSLLLLLIQAIIYILKVSGKCAIVFHDCRDIGGKTNYYFSKAREYIFRTCEIKEVGIFPSGFFKHYHSKIYLLFFIKKNECKSVFDLTEPNDKSKKRNTEIKFNNNNTYHTESIKYFEYDIINMQKKYLFDVSIDIIEQNNFSLKIDDYMIHYKLHLENEAKNNINKMTDLISIHNFMNTRDSKILKNMFDNNNDMWTYYQDYIKENKNTYSNYDTPVNEIIKYLDSKKNRKLSIIDLGCGRENLIQNHFSSNPNFKIKAYDFISINNCIACDISSIPDESESTNICILCESLIGMNWKDYIKEAKRVLCFNGLLIISDLIEKYNQTKDYLVGLEMIIWIDKDNIADKWFSIYAINN